MNHQQAKENLYIYKYTVTRLIDADTLEGSIDTGFHDLSNKRRVRLARINAWEKQGIEKEAGIKALNYVAGLIRIGDKIIIKTLGLDSFGRIVAEVFIPEGNLSDLIVQNGHGIYQTYRNLKKF